MQIFSAIVQLVFFLDSVRTMKDVCMAKCINNLIRFFLNINAVSALSVSGGWEIDRGLR